MGDIWMNPSQSAVIYDRRNNRHLQPKEKTAIAPDPMLVMTGKLLHISSADKTPTAAVAQAPVKLVAKLVVEEEPPALTIAEEDEEDSIMLPRRRKKG